MKKVYLTVCSGGDKDTLPAAHVEEVAFARETSQVDGFVETSVGIDRRFPKVEPL